MCDGYLLLNDGRKIPYVLTPEQRELIEMQPKTIEEIIEEAKKRKAKP